MSNFARDLDRRNAVKICSTATVASGLALVVLTCSLLAACNRQDRRSPTVAAVGPRMTSLMQQRKFDDAVQLGLQSITGRPQDATIYYFVALAYAERAQFEPEVRDRSLQYVVDYSAKSVSSDPNDQLNRFSIAWVLEYAGDVASNSPC